MTSEFLFLYGTLMERYPDNPFRQVIQQQAIRVGEGKTKGTLYRIETYPGLVLSGNSWVWGEVWKSPNLASLFAVLDPYEDFDPENPDLGEYKRMKISVQGEKETYFDAWTYVYIGSRSCYQHMG